MRTATITIDQIALADNVTHIKSHLSVSTKLLAMVKANAYGHDVFASLAGLIDADGFGVATLNEGIQVNKACQTLHTTKPIVLIEGVFSLDEWHTALDHHFGCLIHHKSQLDWALHHTPSHDSFSRTIWLKYNTGMNRLGFDQQGILNAAKALSQKGYHLILTSHFACADEPSHPMNQAQITAFDSMLTHLRKTVDIRIQGSLCNSAGMLNFPHTHYDWVRAGIALYGSYPISNHSIALRPAMEFCAKIMAIHHLKAGDLVGYGGLWVADAPSVIGVVSVGYGDGYPRVVQNAHVSVLINHRPILAPIVGRVAMDMLMIELSHIPAATIGDTVVLWGSLPTADTIARCANTISYELFCRTTDRPIRLIKTPTHQK